MKGLDEKEARAYYGQNSVHQYWCGGVKRGRFLKEPIGRLWQMRWRDEIGGSTMKKTINRMPECLASFL